MSKTIIYPAILLVLLGSFYIVKKIRNHNVPRIELSEMGLQDLEGKSLDLAAFAGKPLVVNFWGTWCGPCRQELPGFEQARQKYSQQINMLIISDEPVEKLRSFKDQNNYHFFYARSSKNFRDLGFTSVPVTYFYHSDGRLSIKKKDPLSAVELDDYIKTLVK